MELSIDRCDEDDIEEVEVRVNIRMDVSGLSAVLRLGLSQSLRIWRTKRYELSKTCQGDEEWDKKEENSHCSSTSLTTSAQQRWWLVVAVH